MKHKWWKKLSVSAAVVALLSGPAMNIVGAEEAFTEEEYAKYNLPTDIDPYNRGEEIKAVKKLKLKIQLTKFLRMKIFQIILMKKFLLHM